MIIVIFPNKWDVLELMRGNKLRYFQSRTYKFLIIVCFGLENIALLQYIDLISIFNNIELTREIIYNDVLFNHYSPFVNSLVAIMK